MVVLCTLLAVVASCGRFGFDSSGTDLEQSGHDANSASDGDASTVAVVGDGAVGVDGATTSGGSDGGGPECTTPPAFCDDLTFYLAFEESFVDAFGESPSTIDEANVTLALGLFGEAGSIFGDLALRHRRHPGHQRRHDGLLVCTCLDHAVRVNAHVPQSRIRRPLCRMRQH